MKTKICTKCEKRKSVSSFRIREDKRNDITYIISECNDCEAIRATTNNLNKRLSCINHYGGCCAVCGETCLPFLTIDHINNDGTKHRISVGNGDAFYRWLVKNKFPKGYRVLCWNCNCTKGVYGRCPHEIK